MTEVNCKNCWKCIDRLVELGIKTGEPQFDGIYWTDLMPTCPMCGRRRCPKAYDHTAECSVSAVSD